MKNAKRKILYISGTRAEYGLLRPTLLAIKKHSKLDIEIIATGMHLMPEFGKTVKEIKKDGFKIYSIPFYQIGEFISELLNRVKRIKPDIIFVQGDRPETLGGAIAGLYSGIPVVHTHGGDVSSTVDEITRHAVTKLAHIHFAATKKSGQRIMKMGEDAWRIFVVGSPGLDSILNEKLISKKEIAKKYKLNLKKPVLLILQHPVTLEIKQAAKQMKETMEVARELGYQTIVVYPNNDPGSKEMIKVIEQYRKYIFIKIYKNISHKDYLSLMKIANVMVGNSSSGIVEAPSLHIDVVNIGQRQKGRERANNVIDVDYNRQQIKKAILKIISNKKSKKYKNPFGDGKASIRIVKVLSKLKINKKLLNKKIAY